MRRPGLGPTTAFVRWTRLAGLLLAAPLLTIMSLPVAIHIARGPDYGYQVHRLEVVRVDPAGPAADAGLRAGDRVLAVDGVPVSGMPWYYAAAAGDGTLAPRTLAVARGPERLQTTIAARRPDQTAVVADYTLWITGLAFLAIGWWVLLQRNDPVARNFFGLTFIFAFFLMDIPDLPYVTYMRVKEMVRMFMQFMLPAYFLRFFIQFPSRDLRAPRAGSQRVQRLLLLPGWLLFLATAGLDLANGGRAGAAGLPILEILALSYASGYFLAGLFIFARRALRRDRPIQRTKMLVVLAGLVAGLVPFLAVTILSSVSPDVVSGPARVAGLSLVLVPTSFALAIMRYGALDRDFVLRVSLVYGVLTLLLLGASFLLVVGLGQLLSTVFRVSAHQVLLIVVAGSSLAVHPLRRLIQRWIDATFYPARRVHRRAVTKLAQELTGLLELDEVVAMLTARLRHLYKPELCALFLSEAPDRPLAPWPGDGLPADVPSLAADSVLARLLVRIRRPVFTEEAEDLFFTGDADPASLRLLTRLDAVLLVPLISGGRLVGFLAFGAKAGGVLYSQEDLHNLRGLALQTGSILESRQFYRETLEQERLRTEMDVAREIQAGLLPVGPLVDECCVVAGRNDSCRTVGGDAYDYFKREDGRLALAIADVAGKGIPAALLMTSLCTAFRREAEGGATPREVAARLNAMVAEQGGSGRFVCFFFGDWDPETGLLRYCNAGMDPPVLFRPGSDFRHRLRKGGPVLGVAPGHRYREGTIVLAAGDRLFLHTDGLTDEQNGAGDFFDEERLLAAVESRLDASPGALLDQVFAAVSEFGDGSATDDKTAIMLEIKKLKDSLPPGPLLAQAARDQVDHRGLPRIEIPLKRDPGSADSS